MNKLELEIHSAWNLANRGFIGQAIDKLKTLRAENPDDRSILYNWALILTKDANPFLGLNAAERYIKKFPDDPQGPLIMANVYLLHGQASRVDGQLDRAEQLGFSSDALKSFRSRADAAVQKKQSSSRVGLCTDFDEINADFGAVPPDPEEDLLNRIQKSKMAGESEVNGAIRTGWWHYSRGDSNRAIEVFSEAIAADPSNVAVVLEMAKLQASIGNENRAIEILEPLSRRITENTEVAQLLFRLLLRKLRVLKALSMFSRHLRANRRLALKIE
jgi:tetratricopeptide (TPR) repeat protein